MTHRIILRNVFIYMNQHKYAVERLTSSVNKGHTPDVDASAVTYCFSQISALARVIRYNPFHLLKSEFSCGLKSCPSIKHKLKHKLLLWNLYSLFVINEQKHWYEINDLIESTRNVGNLGPMKRERSSCSKWQTIC